MSLKYWTVLSVAMIALCNAEWLHEPLTNPNGTVTFDDLGLFGVLTLTRAYDTLVPSINFQRVFTIRTLDCYIAFREYGDVDYGWLSNNTWADLPTKKPGWFALMDGWNAVVFQFSVPINAVSMKINSMTPTTFVIHYVNGTNTSAIAPQLRGQNKFAYFGYRSEMKFNQISFHPQKTIEFDACYVDDIQWIQCPTNQRLRGDICEDYCVSVTCGMHASCDSSSGAAVCRCNTGYEGDGITCQDIDECSQITSPCSPNAYCNNTEGSFTCKCQQGYEGDGFNCTDIDECSITPCGMNAHCNNTEGSYDCTCNQGYEGDGRNCSDIDECSLAPCSTNAYCNNTEGSYDCKCNQGYEGDGHNCSDIDECSLDESPCSSLASCNNTDGSFTCACGQGYEGDGVHCLDIDECSLVPSPCDASAVCNNTAGSFECTCQKGFTGNGLTCEDVNECSLNPCSSLASCNNTAGSFTCTCQEGYSGNGIGPDGCHEIVSPTSTNPPVQAPTVVTTPHANNTPIQVTSPNQVASGVVSSGNQLLWTGVVTMGLMCSFIGAL